MVDIRIFKKQKIFLKAFIVSLISMFCFTLVQCKSEQGIVTFNSPSDINKFLMENVQTSTNIDEAYPIFLTEEDNTLADTYNYYAVGDSVNLQFFINCRLYAIYKEWIINTSLWYAVTLTIDHNNATIERKSNGNMHAKYWIYYSIDYRDDGFQYRYIFNVYDYAHPQPINQYYDFNVTYLVDHTDIQNFHYIYCDDIQSNRKVLLYDAELPPPLYCIVLDVSPYDWLDVIWHSTSQM